MTDQTEHLLLDGREHPVQVRETRRRTLGLYVFPDGRVEIRVPKGTPRRQALDFARGREAWLRDTLNGLPEAPPAPRYDDGARHPYLGDALTLRVRHGKSRRAVRQGDLLWLRVGDPRDPARVEHALREWYRARARTVFAERLAEWFPAVGLPPSRMPGLRIRAMRSRWGSCSSRGGINLNLWLIRAPLACIDYVLVHELAHLLEFNHGPRFYAQMDRMMPDWRIHRRSLRAHQREWG
ncbi:SprT family zinc-dependent metalloprotease [Aquisalimonas sp.]|uniref:M48 family metallopeptidase n=2 Tax=Aquisalimonas sp. TaxID=1872621 RepID=UPI0025C12F79|nr:SprT family zinc-dependent metalloprotease [Aquisalimonas sp.]